MNSEMGFERKDQYHIRVEGSLDEKWADWFDGFIMISREDGSTLLTGEVSDQAALHGVLAQIHRLGLSILLVTRIECPCTSKNCPNRCSCSDCMQHELERKSLPACLKPRGKWDKQVLKVITDTKERIKGQ